MKPNPDQTNIETEKKAIRRYLYLGSTITIILPAALLIAIYSNSLQEQYSIKVQQLTESIMAEKKRFLRNAVDRTIYLIEFEREQARFEVENNRLNNDQVEAVTKERIAQAIRNLRLVDNGYIWVNQIVDYNGGDNYATRLIHPNLPETEGKWLSTNTQDSQGGLPYKTELEGVKENGDVFFEYYFKKMDSDKTAHKMSYAKLYRPYDWIIATGVYIDDVDQLIASETERMHATVDAQKTRSITIAGLAVLGSLLIMIAFEKLIRRLIVNYETKLDNYTDYLEKVSTTDKLTGLFNRLKLDELFMGELERARRYDTTFSVLLIDLDLFKQINDRYGHQIGDVVLQETAAVLLNNARSADSVGRWGGEEFIVICPETSLEGAFCLGEKVCAAVASYQFSKKLSVTCSIGVSTYHKDDSKEDIIVRADRALYLAKTSGRNQIKTETEVNELSDKKEVAEPEFVI